MKTRKRIENGILDRWRNDNPLDMCELTLYQYTRTVIRVSAHHGLTDPRELTASHIRNYFTENGFKSSTRRTYLCALRAYAQWQNIDDPTQNVKRPRIGKRRGKPINEDQRNELLDYLRTHSRPMYVAALLALYAGLRAFEIGKLKAEHIVCDPDGKGGLVTVYDGKDGKTADVYVDSVLISELQPEIERGGYVMERHLTGNNVATRFRYWARTKAGIPCSIHQLRHWFVTWTYRAKRDLVAARDQARHESSGTTENYIQSDAEIARATASMLPGASLHTTGTRAADLPALVEYTDPHQLRTEMTSDPDQFVRHVADLITELHRQEAQLTAVRTLIGAQGGPPGNPLSAHV